MSDIYQSKRQSELNLRGSGSGSGVIHPTERQPTCPTSMNLKRIRIRNFNEPERIRIRIRPGYPYLKVQLGMDRSLEQRSRLTAHTARADLWSSCVPCRKAHSCCRCSSFPALMQASSPCSLSADPPGAICNLQPAAICREMTKTAFSCSRFLRVRCDSKWSFFI